MDSHAGLGRAALEPLVVVHGLLDHSHSFDELARGLVERFHVLALDLRGPRDSAYTRAEPLTLADVEVHVEKGRSH